MVLCSVSVYPARNYTLEGPAILGVGVRLAVNVAEVVANLVPLTAFAEEKKEGHLNKFELHCSRGAGR
jgi:hypothetical protein